MAPLTLIIKPFRSRSIKIERFLLPDSQLDWMCLSVDATRRKDTECVEVDGGRVNGCNWEQTAGCGPNAGLLLLTN